jgi:Glycosyl transferases group 1
MKRAIVVGFDYYAQYLAALTNECSRSWRMQAFPSTRWGTLRALWAMRRADALVSFGGPGPNAALAEVATTRNVPVTVIWAGTDVVLAKASPFDMAVTNQSAFYNIADGPWLVDELRECGVDSVYLPVTAVNATASVRPFPARFRVLTYLPEPRRAFYGDSRIYAIARAMPETEFAVIGNGTRNPSAPPNVTFLGHVGDVPAQIDASTVLLRLPEHDGKSMLVLETLARGRHVIWTHDFPGVRAVDGDAEALTALRELERAHRDGRLTHNVAGLEFVRRTFARTTIYEHFERHLDATVTAQARIRSRKCRVAMSGLGLFCAEVAGQIEAQRPDWKASILKTGSRLEVLTAMYRLFHSDVWYSIGSPITDRWVNLFAKLIGRPRVIHWVGSDIEQLRKGTSLQRALSSKAITHLSEATWTAGELQALGFDSTIAPLPLRLYGGLVAPLPEQFTILLYLPKSRADFYGRRIYEAMLRRFRNRDVAVCVVGGGTLDAPAGVSVVNLGWLDDLRAIYERSTVLVRMPARDGLSLMVLEALSFGRHVIWSQDIPHAFHARNEAELSQQVESLLDRHERSVLLPQHDAAAMIRERYGAERAVEGIVAALAAAGR